LENHSTPLITGIFSYSIWEMALAFPIFFCLSCAWGLWCKLAGRLKAWKRHLYAGRRCCVPSAFQSISSIFKPFQLSPRYLNEKHRQCQGKISSRQALQFSPSCASLTVTSYFTLTETRQHTHNYGYFKFRLEGLQSPK